MTVAPETWKLGNLGRGGAKEIWPIGPSLGPSSTVLGHSREGNEDSCIHSSEEGNVQISSTYLPRSDRCP